MSFHHPSEDEDQQVRFGFTPTGHAIHVIDDWGSSSYTKSMCNIVVRDWEEMVEQFCLTDDEADELLKLGWCGKCESWLKKMRYLQSRGTPTEVPEWVIEAVSEEMGYAEGNLAQVIDFTLWKEQKGYV